MEFSDVIRSANTCRYYKPDAVDDTVLAEVLSAARWGPSGGNRQPVTLIVVRAPAMKAKLRDLYLPIWNAYLERIHQGNARVGGSSRIVDDADHFARHLAEIPVLIAVCARLADVHPTDVDLERLSIVGGASVYPTVQNLILAARNAGLGTALTTLLCGVEPQVKELLKIPDEVSTAALVALGWPVKPFPKKLNRRQLSEMAFAETYGDPFHA
jgi:nitroreductase